MDSGLLPVRFSAMPEKKLFKVSGDAVIAFEFDLRMRWIVSHTILGFLNIELSFIRLA